MALRPEKGKSAVNSRMTDVIKDKYGVKRYVRAHTQTHIDAEEYEYMILSLNLLTCS